MFWPQDYLADPYWQPGNQTKGQDCKYCKYSSTKQCTSYKHLVTRNIKTVSQGVSIPISKSLCYNLEPADNVAGVWVGHLSHQLHLEPLLYKLKYRDAYHTN